MRSVWKLTALMIGLALFGWYVSGVDWRAVGRALGGLGGLAPAALIPYFCVYIVDCLGWRFCLPAGLSLPFVALFRIRWAGESVNNVLPSAYVGGETVKVYLLHQRGVAAQAGASSAVVSKTAQSVAQLVLILLAAIVFLGLAGDRPGLRLGMLVVIGGGMAILAGWFWMQRRGLFRSLADGAARLRLRLGFLERRRESIVGVDRAISDFYRNHRRRFFASAAIYLGGWLLDTMEIFLVAHLLGMPIAWPQALTVEAFTGVAKAMGMWIPGSLGIQESGIVMLGRLAGLPDTLSVAYALLRRVREILFAGIGLLLLYAEHTNLRTIQAEAVSGGCAEPPGGRKGRAG
ncbi:MAG TPA: flippase-like domain-containing protein [Candidatus Paceibacterota bacterium]|nr:flippase-like domain-containing protein [Verrucomicrobiota bacterium]HRZ44701.1 flippase-like domain-containing protein [Candidatus Paceibacterota bacterium]HRZ91687.1 flippase-like domain-containing protein [Candidatus Paceibacterota bacterium]